MSPLITPSCEVANTVVEAAVSSTCRNSPVAFHETFPVRGSYVVREPDADSSSDDAETVMVTLRPFDGSETVSSLEQAVNRDAHRNSQDGFEKSFHSRRMCLLVFSVIGVINAAACFARSSIVQDGAVGKTFFDRDVKDLNRRSGVRSSPPP